jgi:hypothetical protein
LPAAKEGPLSGLGLGLGLGLALIFRSRTLRRLDAVLKPLFIRRRDAMVHVSASGVSSSSVSVSEAVAAASSLSPPSVLAALLLLLLLLVLVRDDGASSASDDSLDASGEGARLLLRRGESGAG